MRYFTVIFISGLLASCASPTEHLHRPQLTASPLADWGGEQLGHYVQELSNELIRTIEHVNPNSKVAVSSFRFVDDQQQYSPVFARQIQESFIYELHKVGQWVTDVKATDFIRVTPDGDFALSKDYLDLPNSVTLDYILLGTLTNMRGGVQVNARLVEITTRRVMAVGETFIPQRVIRDVLPSEQKPIRLVEGES